jgi:hypothetical protein
MIVSKAGAVIDLVGMCSPLDACIAQMRRVSFEGI